MCEELGDSESELFCSSSFAWGLLDEISFVSLSFICFMAGSGHIIFRKDNNNLRTRSGLTDTPVTSALRVQ